MLIPISQVSARIGVSRSTVERLRRNPKYNFPKPIYVGPNSVRFDADELGAWIESRRAGEVI
jgi:excisionase family DNA binding protein